MPKTAVFWIRDGVLIDRMPVNAVAFAISWILYVKEFAATDVTMVDLVNFAFAQSGISCVDKMRSFNLKNGINAFDLEPAVAFYNELSAAAAMRCQYLPGAQQLVQKTQKLGLLNFITSAVEQPVLDSWGETNQGKEIMPYLTEVIGWRSSDVRKGVGHFTFVRERYDVQRIIYVADAAAEIADGKSNSQLFNVVPIGFAHLITPEKVMRALRLVVLICREIAPLDWRDFEQFMHFDADTVLLPNQSELNVRLESAGAIHIVSGSGDQMMKELGHFFQDEFSSLA